MSEQNNKHAGNVFPKGELITNDYFIGAAYLKMLVTDAEMFDCQVANVTFEAGARNNWQSAARDIFRKKGNRSVYFGRAKR